MARIQAWVPGAFLSLVLAGCGGGTGSDPGDGGCKPETDATLCRAAAAECGAVTATDRCGAVRSLDCGGCEDPLWCGGGGEANRCGATCPVGCPEGWSCEFGVCTGGDRTRIALDLEPVTVRGKILLSGAAPVAAPACYDHTTIVSFREQSTGASASALIPCDSAGFEFETQLARGTYAVSVAKYREDDSNLPDGTFVVERSLVIDGPRSGIALDVRPVAVAGRITLNGAAPEAALDCYDHTAVVRFVELVTGSTGSALVPCDSADFEFELAVPAGTYEVSVYKYRNDDSNLPDGTFVVDPALRIDGPASGLVLDLRTVPVGGRLTWNGEMPEASTDCYDYTTVVYFRETTTGTSASALVPCESEDFSFALDLAPGTYEARVSKYRDDDSNLPDGTFPIARSLEVSGPVSGLAFDLRTVPVSGRLRWNGAVPTVSRDCYDYTTAVYFTETPTGTSASTLLPCSSTDFGFDLDLAPGTYAVRVSKYRNADSNLPDGSFLVDPALRVDGPTSNLALDFQTVRVSGTVGVDGRAPTVAGDCHDHTTQVSFGPPIPPGNWWEAPPATSVSTLIPCSSSRFEWSLEIPPGDYRVGVSAYRIGDSSLPAGNFTAVNRLAVR